MAERKLRKFSHQLQRELGVRPCADPTKNLVICNAGFSSGLRERDVASVFNPFGAIDKILLLPGKSFSVVVFADVVSAVRAYDGLNGSKKLTQHGQPLYFTYISSLPEIDDAEEQSVPEGLQLIENFITPEEEEALLSLIDWNHSVPDDELKNRRVKHYGYEFLYSNNNVDLNKPLEDSIPSQCDFLWERLKSRQISIDAPPNQLTVNRYDPGQGIPSHVDTHSAFLSPILSLSMGGSVVMDFKRSDAKQSREHYKLLLPQRSLLVLNGSSRYEWSHGIIPRTYDMINNQISERVQRTSFTFRWVRPDKKCDCKYPLQCDTFKSTQTSQTDLKNQASLIESLHVHQVYEEIASHFDDTRSKIWPCVEKFVKNLPMGSILVDIGCGNGKNLHIRNDIMQIGLEYSSALANIAAWKTLYKNNEDSDAAISLLPIVRGDCLYLPINSNCADAAISIAVFHHLVTEERRICAISEMARLLRPGGEALISVWAKDQLKNNEKTSYLKQDRRNRKQSDFSEKEGSFDNSLETLRDENGDVLNISLPIHKNRTQFLYQDMLVPWKLKNNAACKKNAENTNYMRFYHVFEEDELKNLCESIEGIHVKDSFYEQGNWCVIIGKNC